MTYLPLAVPFKPRPTPMNEQPLAPSSDREPVASPANRLMATRNPALARLAVTLETQGNATLPENYSRMHHRHNRS